MKYSAGKIIFFILLIALSTECKKNGTISDNQLILFEYEYVNYAFNYQHYGFYVDNEGNVLTYNNPEKWNFPDKELRINADQITENLEMCKPSGIRIPKSELDKYAYHIKNIASSKVSALKDAGKDAGSSQYICYGHSGGNNIYKGTIIKMEGDFTCENLNFYSRKIVDWMKEINHSLTVK